MTARARRPSSAGMYPSVRGGFVPERRAEPPDGSVRGRGGSAREGTSPSGMAPFSLREGCDMGRDEEVTEEEWRRRLTPARFDVLREAGTEPPGSGEYLSCKDDGMYCCAGCGAELFLSDTKFESGTGWPSFTEPATAEAVELPGFGPRDGPHRGAVSSLWGSPGPRVSRRPGRGRSAVLHELARAGPRSGERLRGGLAPAGQRVVLVLPAEHADRGGPELEPSAVDRAELQVHRGQDPQHVSVCEQQRVPVGGSGAGDHPFDPYRDLVGGLTAGDVVGPDRPPGPLGANVGRRATLVGPVVPLEQVLIQLSVGETRDARGVTCPCQRAGQHLGEPMGGERAHDLCRLVHTVGREWDVGPPRVATGSRPFGRAVADDPDLGLAGRAHTRVLTGVCHPPVDAMRRSACSGPHECTA